MEALIKQLAKEMMNRGLPLRDTQLAIGCLDTKEQFEEMLAEVQQLETLTRSAAFAIAVTIANDEE